MARAVCSPSSSSAAPTPTPRRPGRRRAARASSTSATCSSLQSSGRSIRRTSTCADRSGTRASAARWPRSSASACVVLFRGGVVPAQQMRLPRLQRARLRVTPRRRRSRDRARPPSAASCHSLVRTSAQHSSETPCAERGSTSRAGAPSSRSRIARALDRLLYARPRASRVATNRLAHEGPVELRLAAGDERRGEPAAGRDGDRVQPRLGEAAWRSAIFATSAACRDWRSLRAASFFPALRSSSSCGVNASSPRRPSAFCSPSSSASTVSPSAWSM